MNQRNTSTSTSPATVTAATGSPASASTGTDSTVNPAGEMPDPRLGLAAITETVIDLVQTVDTASFDRPTPCTEFDVQALLDHLTMVVRRSAAMARGEHFSTVEQEQVGSSIEEYVDALERAATDQKDAWSDSSRLAELIEAPWGTLPGAALAAVYSAELATHGWDLATALDRTFSVPDEQLGAAEFAIRQLPAEGRDHPDVPFGPVVDPGPGAPKLLVIAGWSGRQVI